MRSTQILLSVFLFVLLCPSMGHTTSNLPGDDPLEGIDDAVTIEDGIIDGNFGDDWDSATQNHWYTCPTDEMTWFECEIIGGDSAAFVEIYDGDEPLVSLDYCSSGDGARFCIEEGLNICFRGSVGTYEMNVEPWIISENELEVLELKGFTADPDYIELFGRNGEDMADDFYIGARYGEFVTVDFSYDDPDCEFNAGVVEALFTGAESGIRIADLIQEARIITFRDPDSYILFTVNGCDDGNYTLRCQRKITDSPAED